MVEKLRFRITVISIIALSIVLTLLCIALSIFLRINFISSSNQTLSYISENVHLFKDNKIPSFKEYNNFSEKREGFSEIIGFGSEINENTLRGARFFTVFFDKEGKIYDSDLSHISDISAEYAEKISQKIYSENKDKGEIYQYRFLRSSDRNDLTHIVFLDCSSMMRPLFFSQFMSISISLFLIGSMTLVVWFLSGIAAKPFLKNLETQKQFITNASHEIKTPLAIIDANAEVLKLTEGENEWIDSIQNQTKRLSRLVKRMTVLSKADELSLEKDSFIKFSMTDAILETVSFYKAVAQKKNIKIESNISPDVYLKGDEGTIRQLIEILMENAVKYCDENGTVSIALKNRMKNISFEVTNTCTPPDKKNIDKIFDRFYRDDMSRSRKTGGYGIGLSIAKAVVDNHKGKISASTGDDHFSVTVIL